MRRIRRRRLAWVLLTISLLSAVAVPASAFLRVVIVSPGYAIGMAKGAFGVVNHRGVEWDFEFEYGPENWDSQYALVPTLDLTRWEVTVPVWLTFVVISVLTAIAFRRGRIPPGYCRKCGYNLTGNVSGRCPECGTAVGK